MLFRVLDLWPSKTRITECVVVQIYKIVMNSIKRMVR